MRQCAWDGSLANNLRILLDVEFIVAAAAASWSSSVAAWGPRLSLGSRQGGSAGWREHGTRVACPWPDALCYAPHESALEIKSSYFVAKSYETHVLRLTDSTRIANFEKLKFQVLLY